MGCHVHGRENIDHGGVHNGSNSNGNCDSRDGNRKPTAVWKYIHPVDENTVVEISGTTWKCYKKCVCSIIGKAGFYNRSHTTYEHHVRSPKVDPPQSQQDDNPTPEGNLALSPGPPCDRKGEESSDKSSNDLQWEGV